jgi:L-lactate dehydrogenase complex protein LldG
MMAQIGRGDARDAILSSIRDHLKASLPHDVVHAEKKAAEEHGKNAAPVATIKPADGDEGDGSSPSSLPGAFAANLEAVGGHCIIAHGEDETVRSLAGLIAELQTTSSNARRIALSNAPIVDRIFRQLTLDFEAVAITPDLATLFDCDIGITAVQGAIAETGTLVLESDFEMNRLVSLVPPVHIALVNATDICLTLGEALSVLRKGQSPERGLSRAVTFITGPSRTADIELTLAIGVHGPQELYVIVNDESG